MPRQFDVSDLEEWDERIRAKVDAFGLDCYPQEFELCDHNQMLAYMAYSGMPSHYPHWSYGKSFEKLKTLYDHGVSGLPYEIPAGLGGQITVGALNLSAYQLFASLFSVAVCVGVGLLLTKTRIGMIVRASTEAPERTRALGINVGRWVTPVFGFGVALAGVAGVLAAPFRAITADMGSNFIIILFAVVVIGGLGSILGAVVAGFLVGLVEAYGVAYLPAFAQIVIFILMAVVVLVRPAGLFGREEVA
jgi:branched-chain amino acid transport system permease protein